MSENINIESLQRQFALMGADLQVLVREPQTVMVPVDKNGRELARTRRARARFLQQGGGAPFVADIRGTGKREHFQFRINPELLKSIQVVDVDREGRHLLLNVQTLPPKNQNQHTLPDPQKLLMGHDEYHWFIAPVGRSAVNVAAAKQSLKPEPVQEAQRKVGVKTKHLHKRKQAAFVRQGEWFFMPVPDFVVDPKLILKKEPIRRGRGKPHICEELYRSGGKAVMVSTHHPNGISMSAYNSLTQKERREQGPIWRQMLENPQAYARGKVTHSDHSTIQLKVWHRIRVNNEVEAFRSTGVVMNWLD
jgi:hypothetical protein